MTSRGMTQQQWSAQARDRDARALELFLQGVPRRQIAARHGCTYEAVRLGINRELQRRGLRLGYMILPAPRTEVRGELSDVLAS